MIVLFFVALLVVAAVVLVLVTRHRYLRAIEVDHVEALAEDGARNLARIARDTEVQRYADASSHVDRLAQRHGWNEHRRRIELDHLLRKGMR